MTVMEAKTSLVQLRAVAGAGQPEPTPALEQLYRDLEQELLVPLWTEISGLMPSEPRSRAAPHIWRWQRLNELAAEAGRIVPVGRGGERRAIALANPSLGGRRFATPARWAAIQYLMPGENAPEHRQPAHPPVPQQALPRRRHCIERLVRYLDFSWIRCARGAACAGQIPRCFLLRHGADSRRCVPSAPNRERASLQGGHVAVALDQRSRCGLREPSCLRPGGPACAARCCVCVAQSAVAWTRHLWNDKSYSLGVR